MPWRGTQPNREPTRCECGHARCNHVKGRKDCSALEWAGDSFTLCSCRVYIPRDDDDRGDGDIPMPVPTPNELESLYRM